MKADSPVEEGEIVTVTWAGVNTFEGRRVGETHSKAFWIDRFEKVTDAPSEEWKNFIPVASAALDEIAERSADPKVTFKAGDKATWVRSRGNRYGAFRPNNGDVLVVTVVDTEDEGHRVEVRPDPSLGYGEFYTQTVHPSELDPMIPEPVLNPAMAMKDTAPASDAIFRPAHYARFAIEPITFINANRLPYNIGNVIKYVCRHDAKNGLEDLRKARRYLDIEIETLEREARVKAGEDAREVWKEAL